MTKALAMAAFWCVSLVSVARADVIDFSQGTTGWVSSPRTYADNNLQVDVDGFLYNPPTVNYIGSGLWHEASATANGIGVGYFGAAGTLLANTYVWSVTAFPLSVLRLDLGPPGAEARQLPLQLTLNSVSGHDNFAVYETYDGREPATGPDLSQLVPLASGQVGATPLSLNLGPVADEFLLITTSLANPTQEVDSIVLSSLAVDPSPVPESASWSFLVVALIGLSSARSRWRGHRRWTLR